MTSNPALYYKDLEARHEIQYVARNPALCYFVTAWIVQRVPPPESYEYLTRFYVMAKLHESKETPILATFVEEVASCA